MFDMTPEEPQGTPFEALNDARLEGAEIRAERALEMTNGSDEEAKADLRAIRLEALARALERNDESDFQFDMHTGFCPVSPRTAGYNLLHRSWEVWQETPHRCGTAGCIAGMAYAIWLERQSLADRRGVLEDAYSNMDWEYGYLDGPEFSWDTVRATAMDWLGLTRDSDMSPRGSDPFVVWYGPKLFDPNIERPNGRSSGSASARQAAEACRRVARGQEPWDF